MMPEQQQNMPSYLAALNPHQREAVEALDGPVLVLAGAGTGKTRVLTTRLGHLLVTGKARPDQVLAVTFTNKAANEMKQRVSGLLGGRPVEGWWLGTFHSIAARMLRRHAECVGLKSNFTILDSDDQIRLLKQIMEPLPIDSKKHPPKMLMGIIQKWKDRGYTPDTIAGDENRDLAGGYLQQLYRAYQERLKMLNACDFGDLLLHMITIFRDPKYADILEDYQQRFKYMLVDEYQDTNVAQYLWLRLLAQKHQNICCVGDDDQSIYGWRGAEVGNILKFERDFKNATVIKLEQNYRSTNTILGAANAVIAHNEGRLGKNLWSANEQGDPVKVIGVWDGQQEAIRVSDDIESLQRAQTSLNEIAILVRAGSQTREFEERFISTGIPYRIIGGKRFYERMEVRDALAYFRIVVQPDDDLALERVINTPKRGLGAATVQNLQIHARSRGISLTEAIYEILETEELRPKPRGTLRQLMESFERWRRQLRELSHTELAGVILDESGYTDMWKQDKAPEAAGRLENLKELVNAMAEYENMPSFLEHVALVMDTQNTQQSDMVTIMTLHAAKGLEYDHIFLPAWEEGIFPNQRSMDESGLAGLEEERRLAYVGLTRARKTATILYTANRLMYGNWLNCIPSRFIDELPEDLVDVQSDIVNAMGGGSAYGGGGYMGSPSTRGRSARMVESIPTAGPTTGYSRGANYLTASPEGFSKGDRIRHTKFGGGTVIHVEGNKLDIQFDTAGRKRVVDSFVQAAD
jgi:DNA helicase-2/ATP-dependent DNA helicase PcrA